MLNHEYHERSEISKSKLDKLTESPWHFFKNYIDKHRPKIEPTKSMADGTAIHMAILEPELFDRTYALAPNCRRGTKEWMAAESVNSGKILLKEDEMDSILSSKNAVYAHPVAKELLKGAAFEQSFFWTDPITGVECKCRPDALSRFVSDVKKTAKNDLNSFQSSAANYNYFLQAAFYLDGVFHATGVKRDGFIFITITNEYPYSVACFSYDDEDIEYGRQEYIRLLKLYKNCVSNNH